MRGERTQTRHQRRNRVRSSTRTLPTRIVNIAAMRTVCSVMQQCGGRQREKQQSAATSRSIRTLA